MRSHAESLIDDSGLLERQLLLREDRSLILRNTSRIRTAILTVNPIHFEEKEGVFTPISTKFVGQKDGSFGAPGLLPSVLPNGQIRFKGYSQRTTGFGVLKNGQYSGLEVFGDEFSIEDNKMFQQGEGWRFEIILTETGIKEQLILEALPEINSGLIVLQTEVISFNRVGLNFDPGEVIDHDQRTERLIENIISLPGPREIKYSGIDLSWLSEASFPVIIDPIITVQPDSVSAKDSYIDNGAVDNNYSTLSSLRVGDVNDASRIYRSLLQFDLSSIPSDATIISVVLNLYRYLEKSDNSRTMKVYRIKRDWENNEVTWNEFQSGSTWETAGCEGGNDREQDDIGSLTLDSSSLGWCDFQLDTDKIQTMLAGGSFENNGFLLKNDTEMDDASRFFSSEYITNSALRPKLVIEFETPNPELITIGLKAVVNNVEIMSYETSVRLRAERRTTYLKTKKRGK